jgi:Tol biopolymer transport system component
MNIENKTQRALLTAEHLEAISKANGGGKVNMTYSPRFSPDGNSVCFSLVIDGKSAVYSMDLIQGRFAV